MLPQFTMKIQIHVNAFNGLVHLIMIVSRRFIEVRIGKSVFIYNWDKSVFIYNWDMSNARSNRFVCLLFCGTHSHL